MAIQLEVGKTYRNRIGGVDTIIKYHAGDYFPYKGEHETYKENGSVVGDDFKSSLDLVEK